MSTNQVTTETVRRDALFILKSLKDNSRLGRSNKLSEVKGTLEKGVSLEFDSYFFFLRKFHYIAMDREAQIRLTDAAESVLDGGANGRFAEELDAFFDSQLEPDEHTHLHGLDLGPPAAPPPVPMDEVEDMDDSVEPMQDTGPIQFTAELTDAGSRTSPLTAAALAEALSATAAEFSMPPVSASISGIPAVAPVVSAPKGVDLDNRYTRLEQVGAGPLGTVYQGRQLSLGAPVAIKEFKDLFGYFSFLQRGEVLGRLQRELRAQAAIDHPSVVRVLDQNTEAARPYFVTELLDSNLREKLTDAGETGIEVRWALKIFLQAAYALRAAHAADLTHQNLKPENILLDGLGNAKVSDFGLSRVIEVEASKGMPQVFLGTGGMAYLAPEVLARAKDVGPSADVYSLGIILYEMLTSQIPGRRSPLPSEVNRNVPAGLDAIFDRMTQDKRDQRYPDLDAMLEEFYGVFPSGEYLAFGDLILSN